ncbi:MAG: efflux RND transporter permease subunit [Proteobacteria bacterium]|nr:efflux RND transporter permease subunit [Pseudomonadota bacterium]
MPTETTTGTTPRIGGPIAWMARNSVAANLLMFLILVGGTLGVLRTKQEVFPEFTLDLVRVTMPYPGASPTDVEQGIILAIEEEVRGLDGVKRVTSEAAEGLGTVVVELLLGADPDKALNDVKAAVDRVQTFPEEAESPTVALGSGRREVITVVIAGDVELRTLHQLAERLRSDLLDHRDITQVDIVGVPPVEIAVELPRSVVEGYGLSPGDIARQIRLGSLELPGGELETAGGEILVRVSNRRLVGEQFEDIVVSSTAEGARVPLGRVANIDDGYKDVDRALLYNGKPAVRVTVYRVGDETPTGVAEAARTIVEQMRGTLPGTIELAVWSDSSEVLQQRIDLLVDNAWLGLLLVVLILALFLDSRLALWVSLGIPISFLGAFLLAPGIGLSINMITLFALIVTLGMVVDDAIIVGEHAFHTIEGGMDRLHGAIQGAREMAVPVFFAVLTTIAAFSPMLMVPGTMGKIFRLIPLMVISVLIFSVIESFFILPAHVAHISSKNPGPLRRILDAPRERVSRGLRWFIDNAYIPFVSAAIRNRSLTIAVTTAAFITAMGAVASGLVPFSFFPELEGNRVTASVRLPYGAPEALAQNAATTLEVSAKKTIEKFGGDAIVRGMLTKLGESAGGSGLGPVSVEFGSHLVAVEVNLVPTEQRRFTAKEFSDAWSAIIPPMVGIEALTLHSAAGPDAGTPVDVQLTHRSTEILAAASSELAEELRRFQQLTDIENTYASGKPQLDFRLLPQARDLGITADAVARQIRGAFFGAEALREQRGRDEVRVMVRLADAERTSEFDIEDLRIRTPAGGLVPLASVAECQRGRAPTSIVREDGKRTVNVRARLAAGVVSPRPVLEMVRGELLPQLRKRHPGLDAKLVGQQRSQQESFASLGQNYILALFVIFALLAIPFRSYAQPFIVMAAIPLGLVGAVVGHVIMGFELSLISIFGIVALSGVVVNDSLVLIDATNRFRAEGLTAREAVIQSGARRLRPILLTSLTTFFGLLPMIFETSIQARFLIPMAISLGFGVLFATLVALIVVPCLYVVLEEDIKGEGPTDMAKSRQNENGRPLRH